MRGRREEQRDKRGAGSGGTERSRTSFTIVKGQEKKRRMEGGGELRSEEAGRRISLVVLK